MEKTFWFVRETCTPSDGYAKMGATVKITNRGGFFSPEEAQAYADVRKTKVVHGWTRTYEIVRAQ